jgi:glycerol uptake facilitator-like aquaporin
MARMHASAEILGTFVLVFGGVGTAMLARDRVDYLGVPFAFGLAHRLLFGGSRQVAPGESAVEAGG